MNLNAINGQIRVARQIADWFYGTKTAVSIKAETWLHQSDKKPATDYWLYFVPTSYDVVSFRGEWKEVLALIEWLKGIEKPETVKFSNR